jgi:ankyrin repeat protein
MMISRFSTLIITLAYLLVSFPSLAEAKCGPFCYPSFWKTPSSAEIDRTKERALTLLEQGFDLNETQGERVPLFLALKFSDVEIIRFLTNTDINFRYRNFENENALHIAARYNRKETLAILLEQGIDINSGDSFGLTPLHFAASTSGENVRYLLENSAAAAARDLSRRVPLHFAAGSQTKEAIVHLLTSGADINVRDENGLTPLHYAMMRRNLDLEVIKLLLSAGADPNTSTKDGLTPLNFAKYYNGSCKVWPDLETELFNAGAEPKGDYENQSQHPRFCHSYDR